MPRFAGKGLGGRSGSADAQALANALWVCYFLVVDGKRHVHLLSSGDTDAPPPTSLLIIFSLLYSHLVPEDLVVSYPL